MTLDNTAVSRTRSPSDALTKPSPVHEMLIISRVSAMLGTAAPEMLMPKIRADAVSANAETMKPLAMIGSDRPRNSGSRAAGLAIISPKVRVPRSFEIVALIANRQGVAAYCRLFPITKKDADARCAARPT